MALTWDELAGRSLARQFPAHGGLDPGDVVDLVGRIGPIQSQTARSPFIGLAARRPGLTHWAISAAYEMHGIVRGSTLRGTVHTCTAPDHAVLDAATRIGQRTMFARNLRLADATLEEVWAAQEAYAAASWRSPADLHTHLRDWIAAHDPSARPQLDSTAGRYFSLGFGSLLRKPLRGTWSAQGAPGYRTATSVLGADPMRDRLRADPDTGVDMIVRRHLTAYGPSSRNDIAWWSGIGLRPIDAALARLADTLTHDEGPDGRVYWDLPRAPSMGQPPPLALLPEYDALLCGYDPPARARFVDSEHYDILWKQENGLLLAPVLIDGRLRGYWRLNGTGRRRDLAIRYVKGARRPTKSALAEPISALKMALDSTIGAVDIGRD